MEGATRPLPSLEIMMTGFATISDLKLGTMRKAVGWTFDPRDQRNPNMKAGESLIITGERAGQVAI